jgi:transposase
MKRITGSGIKSWELTEELWERVKDFVPQRKQNENKAYQRKPGAGRKPIPPRRVLEAIIYVLRTGIQWKALPKAYGAASSIHEHFSEWAEAGFFQRMWQEGLLTYDEVHWLGWEWQSTDGCMVKTPLARDVVGRLCQNSLSFAYIVLFALLCGVIPLYIAVTFQFFEF